MNKLKKLGLTALASSLVVTSASAGALSVSGGASLGVKNDSNSSIGKSWTMGNSVTISGGGELDNGLSVSISFELDNGDSNSTTTPFDNHSLTVSSDSLGSLTFFGHGGSTAVGGASPLDLWDNGSGATSPDRANPSNNMLKYTLPSIVDGLAAVVSYTPNSSAGMVDSDSAWNLTYTGVEGLSVSYGQGTDSDIVTTASTSDGKGDHDKLVISYAYGPITAQWSDSEYTGGTAAYNEEVNTWKLSYTVSENISVTYAEETHEEATSAVDEEFSAITASYTSGGVTLSLGQWSGENMGNSAAVKDHERWKLGASFAF